MTIENEPQPGDEKPMTSASTRLFQITEDDLAELERILPVLWDRIAFNSDQPLAKGKPGGNKLRAQIRKVQSIIVNVRWDYGPPADTGIIPSENGLEMME